MSKIIYPKEICKHCKKETEHSFSTEAPTGRNFKRCRGCGYTTELDSEYQQYWQRKKARELAGSGVGN